MDKQRWQDWVTTIAGAYVFFTPWIIPYFSPTATMPGPALWSHYIAGVLIAATGLAALASYRLWEEWVEAALGVWLVIAPWVMGYSDSNALTWNSVVVGVIVVAMSMGALAQLKALTQRGA